MPEKLSPYASPAEKILSLYGLLLFSGKQHSLAELARRLRCSKQTVLRLVDQIERSHQAKVESWMEGGRRWFRIKTPPVRPQVCLDAESIRLLLLCRDFVCHLLPQALREEISRAIAHTTVLLPDLEERARALTQVGAGYSRGRIDYTEHQHLLDVLLEALADRRVCRVSYQSPKRTEPWEYCIAPLTLIAHHGTLYLRCWLVADSGEPEVIHDGMLLAVQRLREVELTERTFAVREEPVNEEAHIFGLMREEPFRVQVRFHPEAAAYVRERRWSADQNLTPLPDGGLLLEFTAASQPEVVS
ncbi:MAG: WYL domain-containing protein [Deltaproteobacteria bacterium]|nr:WYL domain-containing protein [Deltaproteobacteria bacterium]MBW1991727.1 WYL domain-containing protein [Deltaproteobacteria bacterium]